MELANGLNEKQMIFYCRMLGFSGRKSKKTSEDVEKQHALIKEFEAQIRQDQKEKCAKYVHKTISLSIDNDDAILLKNVDKAIMEAD